MINHGIVTDSDSPFVLSGPRYSPNLRKWLIKNERTYWGQPKVFRDLDNALWVGWIDDDMWFIGCRLMRCLTAGAKAEVGCWTFPIATLTELPDFWGQYAAIGRCAIDGDHRISFVGDETRWNVEGDTRSCLWCGDHVQRLKRWTETVERSRWEPARLTPALQRSKGGE